MCVCVCVNMCACVHTHISAWNDAITGGTGRVTVKELYRGLNPTLIGILPYAGIAFFVRDFLNQLAANRYQVHGGLFCSTIGLFCSKIGLFRRALPIGVKSRSDLHSVGIAFSVRDFCNQQLAANRYQVHKGLFCSKIGLFCRQIGLFWRALPIGVKSQTPEVYTGLFCGQTGLFYWALPFEMESLFGV